MRRACLVGLLLIAMPSTAGAEIDASQIKAWQQTDRLLAQSNIVGARAAAQALRAVPATLPVGAERAWLDHTLAAVDYYAQEQSTNAPAISDLRVLIAQTPVPNAAGELFPTPSDVARAAAGGTCAVKGVVNGRILDTRNPSVEVRGSIDGFPSFWAGDMPFSTWPKGTLQNGVACNLYPMRFDGIAAVWRGGMVAIPASQPIVTSRKIGPGGSFKAQVATRRGKKLRARWFASSSAPIRTGYKLLHEQAVSIGSGLRTVTLKAPRKRGRYLLLVTIDKPQQGVLHHTGIADVGVGQNPAKREPTYAR